MSDNKTPEYKALFKENQKKINSKLEHLIYPKENIDNNSWARLGQAHIENAVITLNESYLTKILLGTDTTEEKAFLSSLEIELLRRKNTLEEPIQAQKHPIFGDE